MNHHHQVRSSSSSVRGRCRAADSVEAAVSESVPEAEVVGSLQLGNVRVFVQLICRLKISCSKI